MPDIGDSSDAPRRPNLPQRRAPKREAAKPARVDRDAETENIKRSGKRTMGARDAASKQSGAAASRSKREGAPAASSLRPRASTTDGTSGPKSIKTGGKPTKGTRTAPPGRPKWRASARAKGASGSAQSAGRSATGKVSARGHLRVSWLFLTVVAVVIIGAFTLSPSISLLIEQRAEIDELQADIDERNENIDELLREVGHWNDPAYVQAQARDRLFYVFPDEEAFTVIDDRDGVVDIDDTSVIETELVTEDIDWATVGFRSIIMAGVTELTPDQLRGNSVVVED
ncbi:MAG TPA: septum formation initiator family protein [Candidatus Agrococcus pullicola]|uniref:Septum formation initiator family protein n=1 Tax=Candidatus Agrococcus pullicola TaxID=2838429 RepID=A0A9D1YWS2_9MICO|nr:septum formation initiator family protein [Candidatus Agrococcus pullicola]